MRFFSLSRFSITAVLCYSLFSCNEKEEFFSDGVSEYLPLAVGKYITYRADSTIFTAFGTVTEIHKYQVKHIVDAKLQDAAGRTFYRINVFTRDSVNTSSWSATQPWINAGTYAVTPKEDQIEVVDNNLRFIKLHLPVKEGYTWRGNRFLPDNPYDTLGYKFSNDDNMEDWDYNYNSFSPDFSYRGNNYSNVYTVEAINDSLNVPIVNPGAYASKTISIEKYAKSIGMVYRQYDMWEHQPNTGGTGGPYKIGWGLKMWMIDHN